MKTSLFSRKDFQVAFLALLFILAIAPFAMAITAPAAGSFAYDVYDIGVNQMLKGPIGFVAGVVAIIMGAAAAIMGEVMYAIPAILGGGVLLKADALVTSLGALI
ncbi:hypothetical protein [Candidatus Manganitrophus noduliformans]|uniref:Uncharacterized protein n=1 Tax=Candidatus Manganitrophus noduliformans TaxID=2606439 RepID=A0A7X6DN36_9BACT|nr:hypothetical protein [Candidatus Manganitrophus noduliformans]NKE70157.1 hypothetical protein [Candidatus Manganitrophus noduliformans]